MLGQATKAFYARTAVTVAMGATSKTQAAATTRMNRQQMAMPGSTAKAIRHASCVTWATRSATTAMIADAVQAKGDPDVEITLGADKGYDAKEFSRRQKR